MIPLMDFSHSLNSLNPGARSFSESSKTADIPPFKNLRNFDMMESVLSIWMNSLHMRTLILVSLLSNFHAQLSVLNTKALQYWSAFWM